MYRASPGALAAAQAPARAKPSQMTKGLSNKGIKKWCVMRYFTIFMILLNVLLTIWQLVSEKGKYNGLITTGILIALPANILQMWFFGKMRCHMGTLYFGATIGIYVIAFGFVLAGVIKDTKK